MPAPLNVTSLFSGTDYKLLPGAPSDHCLPNATAAHTFTLGEEEAVFWAVGRELTGEEIRKMAKRLLADWK